MQKLSLGNVSTPLVLLLSRTNANLTTLFVSLSSSPFTAIHWTRQLLVLLAWQSFVEDSEA